VKKIERADPGVNFGHLMDHSGLEKYPALAGFLHDAFYEGTNPPEDRLPGSVYLVARDGVLQVTLKEPTQGLLLRVEVDSWKSMLVAVEAALTGPASLWQVDPWARKPKKKK